MAMVSSEMADLVFDLQGESLPRDHAYLLWQAVQNQLPWLAENPAAGILPLRGSPTGETLWLPRRTKLVLRLGANQVESARQLCGQQLEVGEAVLKVGNATERHLQHYPTLHAQRVASALPEVEFLEAVAADLAQLSVRGQGICGMAEIIGTPDGTIRSYSLVINELNEEQSLQLQQRGLGAFRHLGCGIFVPFKVIPSL
jgi:CRISPR-associated protein Cas6